MKYFKLNKVKNIFLTKFVQAFGQFCSSLCQFFSSLHPLFLLISSTFANFYHDIKTCFILPGLLNPFFFKFMLLFKSMQIIFYQFCLSYFIPDFANLFQVYTIFSSSFAKKNSRFCFKICKAIFATLKL